MKKLNLILLLLIGFGSFAQCPVGDVSLYTQADVDNFQVNYPNCNVIDGDFTISGLDITDLTPLINITQVTGTLQLNTCGFASLNGLQNLTSVGSVGGQEMLMIYNNQNLQDMSQLYNLNTVIGDLWVYNNDNVVTLYGLQGLNAINGNLFIVQNDGLVNFFGLHALVSVGSIGISQNTVLQDISQISSLNSVNTILIENNAQLNSLSGLQGLTNMSGNLKIEGNNINSCSGLNNLVSIGSFSIKNEQSLTSLSGLQSLTTVNGLTVEFCPQLQSFDALENLNSVGNLNIKANFMLNDLSALNHPIALNSLTVTNNNNLQQCAVQAICDYLDVNTATIQSNNFGCNSETEVENQCATLTQLLPIHCGEQLTTFDQVFHAEAVTGATEYEFQIWNILDPQNQQVSGSVSPSHSLEQFGLFELGQTYEIRVKAKINGIWYGYGPICQLYSPVTVPETQITASNCNQQLITFDELFYATEVSGATQYEFEFTNTQSGQVTLSNSTDNSHSLQAAGLTNFNQIYNVRVRAYIDGTWGAYGTSCAIHAPISPCPIGDVILLNQNQVDQFIIDYPTCTEIDGNLFVTGSLNDLSPLSNLVTIHGDFSLSTYSSALSTLTGIHNIATVDGELSLYINGTTNITDLTELTALATINSLKIGGSSLTSMTGLENLTSLNGGLTINDADNLTNLTGLQNINSIGGDVYLNDNLLLQDLTLLSTISNWNLNQLTISQNNALIDLNGFQNVTSVEKLVVSLNDNLITLNGLNSLTNIGANPYYSLEVSHNQDLQSIAALSNVTSIGGGISMTWNQNLISYDGMQGITNVPYSMNLSFNGVSDLTGFNNLASTPRLTIDNNPNLTSLNGLENLTTVSGDFFRFAYNPNLTDIQALNHPIVIPALLQIYFNSSLSTCNAQAVCDYVDAFSADIHHNDGGCDSQAEVQASCAVPLTQLKPAHCGEQLTTFNEVFYADAVPGATEYQFKFTDTQAPYDEVENYWTSTGHHLILVDLLEIDKTYDVQVRAKVNDVWGLYGQVCQIHSPNVVPTTQLKTIHCGEQLTTFNEVFYADLVYGATQYEFLFTDDDGILAPVNSPWTSNGHHLQIPGLLEVDKTYNVQVRAYIDGTWGDFGAVCQIHSPNGVPLTQLISTDCGKQLTTFNEVFKTETVQGATQYEFKFTNVNTFAETTNTWSGTGHTLILLGLLEIGQTYDVQTRAQVNGVWGDWGPVCQIHSPLTVPTTQLKPIHCGEQLTTFNEVFKTETVYGADLYEFMFTNTLAPFTVTTNTWTGTGHHLQLLNLFDLGQTYDVQTRAQVNGVWSDWGPVCQIHSPLTVPNTNIYASDCGTTMSSYNEVFKCDAVAGADLYRFRFYDGTNYSTNDRTVNTNTLNIAGLLVQNVTYQVDVMARINGVWGAYDQACPITAPPTPPMNLPGQDDNTIGQLIEGSTFTAGIDDEKTPSFAVYPNPAIEVFSLRTDLDNYNIKLYSTNGQLVYSDSQLSGTQQIEVSQFDAGLYILQISDSENVLLETTKITVMK